MQMRIRITKGNNMHEHFRQLDNGMLQRVAPHTARYFCRAVAEPNTAPAIKTADDAVIYREQILEACPKDSNFVPIMAIMLTRATTRQIVREAGIRGVKAIKYIPLGVSTNADESVPLEELHKFYPCLEEGQKHGMVFCGHWQSMFDGDGNELPEINREVAAIPYLDQTVRALSGMKITAEHPSTRHMVDYVRACPLNIGATPTVHHSTGIYNQVCNEKGAIIDPFMYCKPILQPLREMAAVARTVTSCDPHFFLGLDGAPWLPGDKQGNSPKAGIWTPAWVAIPMVVQLFEDAGELVREHIDNFMAHFGADFYGLPRNTETIEVVQEEWIVPDKVDDIAPYMAGKTLRWKIAE
jgi:dihydroorotase